MTATARFVGTRRPLGAKSVHKARRPFTAVAVLATAAHHGFELWAGVGLVFQPFLTLPGAVALWEKHLASLIAETESLQAPHAAMRSDVHVE